MLTSNGRPSFLAPVLSLCVATAVCYSRMSSKVDVTSFVIAPGVQMPVVNVGTCCGSDVLLNVPVWLMQGGHGIDTAQDYGLGQPRANRDQTVPGGTQAQLGQVLRSLQTQGAFVTTKIPAGFGRTQCSVYAAGGDAVSQIDDLATYAHAQVVRDLEEIGTTQVDLLLLHGPCRRRIDSVRMWRGLERALDEGIVRAIGVSNYDVVDLAYLLPRVRVKPAVNQCQMSLQRHNNTDIAYAAEHGITYQAWGVLAGCPWESAVAQRLASERNATVAQICMRWVYERGATMAIGLGSHAERLAAHARDTLDIFTMAPLGMAQIRALEIDANDGQGPPRFRMYRERFVDE